METKKKNLSRKARVGLSLGVAAALVAVPLYFFTGSGSPFNPSKTYDAYIATDKSHHKLTVTSHISNNGEFRAELSSPDDILGELEVFLVAPGEISKVQLKNTFYDNSEKRTETASIRGGADVEYLDRNTWKRGVNESVRVNRREIEIPPFARAEPERYGVRGFDVISVNSSSGNKWTLETTFKKPSKDSLIRFYIYPFRANRAFHVPLVPDGKPITIDAKISGR